MLYPAFVELGDETHAYGVVLPDFPGCFSAADEAKDLPAMVQEAVEVHLQGMDGKLPQPSRIKDLRHLPDYDYDGVWMLFDIDESRISSRARRFMTTSPNTAAAAAVFLPMRHGRN